MAAHKPVPHRRWFRFSLRTFFVLVTAVCVALGLYVKRQRDRHLAIETIKSWGGVVQFLEFQPPISNRKFLQLRRLLEASAEAEHLGLPRPELPEELPQGKIWQRRMLGPYGKYHGSAVVNISVFTRSSAVIDFSVLAPLTEIKRLTLSVVDDNALSRLPRLPMLESVGITSSENVSVRRLEWLSRLPNLQNLELTRGSFAAASLADIASTGKLTTLTLTRSHFHDNGLRELARLKNLTTLNLQGSDVTNEELAHLHEIKSLKTLHLEDTYVTDPGVLALQTALPNCRIRTSFGIEGVR